MKKFAKLNDDEHIEFAPASTPLKSNFNLDEEACLGAGYLEVLPYPAYPDDSDGRKYKIKYQTVDNKIEPFWAEIIDNRDYAQKRKAEYPEVGDQLDAIIKALAVIDEDDLNGIILPEDTKLIISACKAVKAKYPKPDETKEVTSYDFITSGGSKIDEK